MSEKQIRCGEDLNAVLEELGREGYVMVGHYGHKIDDDGHELWSIQLYNVLSKKSIVLRVKRVAKDKIIVKGC